MRQLGAGYQAWLDSITAKYPDAYARTIGSYGWDSLGCEPDGSPSLIHSDGGPHYTDVSSRTYSTQRLVGSYNHNTDTYRLFVTL